MFRKIILYIFSAVSMVLVPLLAALSLFFFLFLNVNFHVSVIKGLNLTETIIKLKNYQMESDIRHEIEKKTGISQFKPEYERIKKIYDEKLQAYNILNKTEEYDKLDKQIDELDDTDWENAPDTFKNEDEWKAFKKQKIKDLKAGKEAIKKYRDKNEDAIDKAEDEMDAAKDAFEDADDTMKSKEEDAKDILEERSGDLMNELMSDVAQISPELSRQINSLFIETEVRKLIKTYLDFFTSYYQQKKAGNVYESGLNIESGAIGSTRKVVLPAFELSFVVKTDENGITKEKNIFSEIFVETIRRTPGLKSPWVLTKIFSMADSWIAEKVAASFFKGTGISYRDGVIKSGPVTLSGDKARIAEYIMIAMTLARYLVYAGPAVLLLILLVIFAVAPGRKLKWILTGLTLEIPSVILCAAGITCLVVSSLPGIFMTIPVSDPSVRTFVEQGIFSSGMHVFIPFTVMFFILAVAGSFMHRRGKRISE